VKGVVQQTGDEAGRDDREGVEHKQGAALGVDADAQRQASRKVADTTSSASDQSAVSRKGWLWTVRA
jgi:hypothetical protein